LTAPNVYLPFTHFTHLNVIASQSARTISVYRQPTQPTTNTTQPTTNTTNNQYNTTNTTQPTTNTTQPIQHNQQPIQHNQHNQQQ
jgi:hypothetical protein